MSKTIVRKQARQGDVFVRRVKPIITPSSALYKAGIFAKVERENGRIVLAHGEVTGHAHAIDDSKTVMFRDPQLNRIFFNALNSVELVHDEHSAIGLEAGTWEVIRQREWDERQTTQWVAD
jgi:hypothetical protein